MYVFVCFYFKVIATVAVMKHNATDDWAWLYRLAVNQKYLMIKIFI